MKRAAFLLAVLLLLGAACGDSNGEGGTVTTAIPPTTEDAEEPTTQATAAPTTQATEATEGEGASTGGDGGLAITAVTFGGVGSVTLTNLGSEPVSLDGMWLCNRPQYLALSGELAAGESTDIPAADLPPLNADGGDLGLYTDADFGNADAIVDYVAWGGGGGRLSTAVEAGIWPDGDAVAGGGAGISAPGGGDAAADWASS